MVPAIPVVSALVVSTVLATSVVTAARADRSTPAAVRTVTAYGSPASSSDLTAAFVLVPELPRPGALRDAAARTSATPAERARAVRQLRAWAPADRARVAAQQWATARGLHVDHPGRWVVQVSGPAARMAAAFGVRLVSASSPYDDGRYVRPDRRLRVPVGLRGHVTGVVGLDTRPVMRPSTHVPGKEPADLRSAYRQVGGTLAGAGLTVGTVQFSDWNANDLAVYADDKDLPYPLDRLTQVVVNGGTDSRAGEAEVALDTQMVLATAPYARQRVYNGPNNGAGIVATYAAMADDAEAGRMQILSSSWGACEENNSPGLRDAVRTHIQRMVAAGATMFAASGDFGSADCYNFPLNPDLSQAVDFPASVPETVGVGGTRLVRSGDSWTETAWGNGGASPQSGGSGGGVSHVYGLPSYQADVPEAGTRRMVPDISAVGDPATGVSSFNSGDGWIVIGGTSASAPINAGLLAGALSDAGYAHGIGSIHRELYDAPRSSFRDPTVGDNGAYSANSGYDLVTGLGSPLWSRIVDDLGVRPASYRARAVPKRVMDTGTGLGSGVGERKIAAGRTVTLTLPRDLVDDATSVVLNVVTSGAREAGRLAVYPASYPSTAASSVSYAADDTAATLVTVEVGDRRRVAFRNAGDGPVHVAADLQGRHVPGTAGLGYRPLDAHRVFDTRTGKNTRERPIKDGATRTFRLPSRYDGIEAAFVKVSAVADGRRARLTVYPASADRSKRWTLDVDGGSRASNLVSVRVGAGRKLTVHNRGPGAADVVLDVEGVFRAGGGAFHARPPVRLFDTGTGAGSFGDTPVRPGRARSYELPGHVPGDARAVLLSVTLRPRARGTLTVYPAGADRPAAWSSSFVRSRTTTLVAVRVGDGDRIRFANRSDGRLDVRADLVGFYA